MARFDAAKMSAAVARQEADIPKRPKRHRGHWVDTRIVLPDAIKHWIRGPSLYIGASARAQPQRGWYQFAGPPTPSPWHAWARGAISDYESAHPHIEIGVIAVDPGTRAELSEALPGPLPRSRGQDSDAQCFSGGRLSTGMRPPHSLAGLRNIVHTIDLRTNRRINCTDAEYMTLSGRHAFDRAVERALLAYGLSKEDLLKAPRRAPFGADWVASRTYRFSDRGRALAKAYAAPFVLQAKSAVRARRGRVVMARTLMSRTRAAPGGGAPTADASWTGFWRRRRPYSQTHGGMVA